jgi:phosphoribosylaminoimidazole-succinocarboxamide synthase
MANGTISGMTMPPNLKMASRLPSAIFTPTTKAPAGSHDQNIDFKTLQHLLGSQCAERIRNLSIELYERAAAYALARGVIIADTKFEFGFDADGQLLLIDEALTPDSSRYWPSDQYCEGTNPPSFDKQPLVEWLSTVKVNDRPWNRMPPAPALPMFLIEQLRAGYESILKYLIQ